MLTEHPGVDFLADSRIQNLKSYAAQARQAGKQTVLLRLSMPSEVSEVVEYADVSFQSELSTIRLLDEAAGRAGKRHNVVLMIDDRSLIFSVLSRVMSLISWSTANNY